MNTPLQRGEIMAGNATNATFLLRPFRACGYWLPSLLLYGTPLELWAEGIGYRLSYYYMALLWSCGQRFSLTASDAWGDSIRNGRLRTGARMD